MAPDVFLLLCRHTNSLTADLPYHLCLGKSHKCAMLHGCSTMLCHGEGKVVILHRVHQSAKLVQKLHICRVMLGCNEVMIQHNIYRHGLGLGW